MTILEAVILAMIQGFTEFLPISSSAHLALAPWLLGWRDQGLTFDIALHFGTLLAVVTYFFKEWLQIFSQACGLKYSPDPDLAQNPNLFWWLVAGTLPVGFVGLAFKSLAETSLRSPYVIGTMLIIIGLLMWYAERISSRNKEMRSITFTDAMLISVSQALAVVPGTSRSGITIAAGLLRNVDRRSAARFSFLLSTPAIAAAALKAFWDFYHENGGIGWEQITPFIIGILVSAVTGLLVIDVFLTFLRRNSLKFFVYYRVIFGIIVIALAFLRGPFRS